MTPPPIPEEAVERKCPTCGSAVRVAGDPVEGTMHYEPASGALFLTTEEKRALLGLDKPECNCGGVIRHSEDCAANPWWKALVSARQKLEESLRD